MSTMNSNTRIAAARCSLGTWFVSGIYEVSVDTLHKGHTDDDDDDNNNSNNNNYNAGTSDMSTMNSNTRIAVARCSRTWFVSGIYEVSVDTLHKGHTDDDDDDDDNNNNNNNNNNAGTSDMRTMNSNTRTAAARCSLGTWFVSGIYV